MAEVNTPNVTVDGAETPEPPAPSTSGPPSRRRQWILWGCAITIVVAASLWYAVSRTSGPTVSATLADCSQLLVNSNNGQPVSDVRPILVGLGAVASVAVMQTSSGPAWCFDGMGVGGGGVSRAAMRAALSAPVAVVDGTLTSDVLMLVHLGLRTTSVVVTTATSRSNVLAQGGGFEVLRVPMTWPHWHAPWRQGGVTLGRITGFAHDGQVTSSLPFSWCPGSINIFPGTAC
jgi:hypothetical protein